MPLMMKLPGITGEGSVQDHAGWLHLTGFDWGGTRATQRVLNSTGRAVVRVLPPQLRSATVHRKADSQSAPIWKLMVGRTVVPKVTLEWLRTGAGATPVCFFSVEFSRVQIARVAEASTGEHPIETLTLVYTNVTLGVRDVGNALSGAQDIVSFDVPTNQGG